MNDGLSLQARSLPLASVGCKSPGDDREPLACSTNLRNHLNRKFSLCLRKRASFRPAERLYPHGTTDRYRHHIDSDADGCPDDWRDEETRQ